MGLRAYAVDGNALRNPLVDVVDHATGNLGIVGDVKVVVVDVQLGVGVGAASSTESNSDEVLTKDTAKDTVAETAVLSEDLVYNVPVGDFALVARYHSGDMVLDDLSQGVAVPDVIHPLGKLGVPKKSVATDLLAVGLSPIDDAVSIAEAELVALGWKQVSLSCVRA